MSINNRVVQLIEKTVNSKSAFSNATGISTVILSHISSGRNKVSLTAVQQILKAYPNVNADWLVSGHGQMLKDGLDKSVGYELLQNIDTLSADFEKLKKSVDSNIAKLKATLDEISA